MKPGEGLKIQGTNKNGSFFIKETKKDNLIFPLKTFTKCPLSFRVSFYQYFNVIYTFVFPTDLKEEIYSVR